MCSMFRLGNSWIDQAHTVGKIEHHHNAIELWMNHCDPNALQKNIEKYQKIICTQVRTPRMQIKNKDCKLQVQWLHAATSVFWVFHALNLQYYASIRYSLLWTSVSCAIQEELTLIWSNMPLLRNWKAVLQLFSKTLHLAATNRCFEVALSINKNLPTRVSAGPEKWKLRPDTDCDYSRQSR